ncbi:calcium-responsive transcription factor-like [Rhizophagus clarus]|uniref:Calcium-responsive transcription factor-like n=1 Tax=Rhizophagus clarus TaxID=94130 RepID=A0A8H3LXB9_9GLOM|nr:calcium-responsive transcription factor-like [Rhizophagus clarus]
MDLGESVRELRGKEVTNIKYKIHGSHDARFVGNPQQELNIRETFFFIKTGILNSTHKTNKYDCRLFTLYVCNNYGCWDVEAHFFVSNENSDTVAEGLKAIKQFARCWNPRYFLSDQSNIESHSIKIVLKWLFQDFKMVNKSVLCFAQCMSCEPG